MTMMMMTGVTLKVLQLTINNNVEIDQSASETVKG